MDKLLVFEIPCIADVCIFMMVDVDGNSGIRFVASRKTISTTCSRIKCLEKRPSPRTEREKKDVRTLSAEEFAGDVEGFTSNNDDFLSVKQLLGHDAGQATQEVSLAVDNDLNIRTS